MSDPGHRQIYGLSQATALLERPACIPVGRPRGAKAAGLRFEKAAFEALSGGIRGQWFQYEDVNGPGYCQPDIIYPFLPDFFAVIEVKYTLVPGAHQKLSQLYLPVASMALKAPCAGVVLVKNLDPRYRRGKIYTDLRTAAEISFHRGFPTLVQWAGQPLIRPDYPSFTVKSRAAMAAFAAIASLSLLNLTGCEEPPPCGLLSINSTVHCHSDTPPPPTEELPGHEQPLYPYQPHQRG